MTEPQPHDSQSRSMEPSDYGTLRLWNHQIIDTFRMYVCVTVASGQRESGVRETECINQL